jgi:hypothetical protein
MLCIAINPTEDSVDDGHCRPGACRQGYTGRCPEPLLIEEAGHFVQ